MSTLLLIDGNAVLHRAFHAIPQFATKAGVPTNAVYGFLTMLQKAIVDFKPTHLIICFDTPTPTFRKKLHKEYQAHRPKMDDELKTQFPLVKELLNAAGIKSLEKPGFEADDVIGTIAKKCNSETKVIILTGDRDIMQLVNDHVFVVSPQSGLSAVKIFDKTEVFNKLNIYPQQIPDLKALMGDPSDNYKGAQGIGPKTAVGLLQKFADIDNLFTHLDDVENPRIKLILEREKENILMSKQLATIKTDVDVDCNLENAEFNGFKPDIKDFLNKFEMYSLLKRLFPEKKFKEEEKIKKKNDPQMGLF